MTPSPPAAAMPREELWWNTEERRPSSAEACKRDCETDQGGKETIVETENAKPAAESRHAIARYRTCAPVRSRIPPRQDHSQRGDKVRSCRDPSDFRVGEAMAPQNERHPVGRTENPRISRKQMAAKIKVRLSRSATTKKRLPVRDSSAISVRGAAVPARSARQHASVHRLGCKRR